MAKKKSTKKNTPKAPKAPKAPRPLSMPERRSVNITKAQNGFVVNSYDNNTGADKTFIAKTKKEAKGFADKFLDI